MQPVFNHSWNLTAEAATQLQNELSVRVVREDRLDNIHVVAGVDVAYQKDGGRLVAAVACLDAATLDVIEVAIANDIRPFTYQPGLFAFRELPALVKAFEKLVAPPQLVLCDGHGIAHPRRFGLASHLGVLFDIPTIGCGKTRLVGQTDEPPPTRGSQTLLVDNNEVVGALLRTQDGVKPVFVSIGHRVSLSTVCKWVLAQATRYRLPEAIRTADQIVRRELKVLAA